jgi:hypothetical protein
MAPIMITRLAQNLHTTTGDVGATSTHNWNAPLPDPMRRTISPGLMNATSETLGCPPAIQVAAVRISHGTIHSERIAQLVPMSCHVRDRYRGAAAISP